MPNPSLGAELLPLPHEAAGVQLEDPTMNERPIGIYPELPAACLEHDPHAPAAAGRVAALITSRLPDVAVEHIGSTAVPGCAGKGVVDLMVLYPAGRLQAVKDCLAALGFQRQGTRDPFPEDRPMRVGTLVNDGRSFRLHVHVLAADAPEAAVLRGFRDRLRANAELRAAYVARKREILAAGFTDSLDYCEQKGPFITATLSRTLDGGGVLGGATREVGMSDFTLTLNERERLELVRLLEQALGDTRVELHHTHTPGYREGVKEEEVVIRGLLQRLAQRSSGTGTSRQG
jgi:GrpB-like predicted nucleotidyltransferase (UPF0157 family)